MLKKISAVFLVCAILACSMPIVSVAAENGVFELSQSTGYPGDQVEVTLKLTSNPGVVLLNAKLSYSSDLTLISATDSGLMGVTPASSQNTTDNPYIILWNNGSASADSIATGTLMTFVFKIKDTAATGDKEIKVTSPEAYNYSLENVSITEAISYITVTQHAVNPVTVLAGSDRYETSAEISRASYDSADCAILALGTNFPDALAGGPLAFAENAPILLIKAGEIPEVTQDELTRLGVTRVIILGGTAGIGTAVEDKLEDMGITFERLAGADRYITAVKIAEALREKTGEGDTAVIACGTNFPDALSIGSYAAKSGIPILLSKSGDLPDATADALRVLGITKVIIAGGTVSISGSVQAEIESMGITVTRVSGSDRYSTGVAVAQKYHSSSVHAVIANGTNFPDALSAVPYAAMYNAPILLVKTDDIPDSVSVYISGSSIKTVSSAGGTAAVGRAVLTELESLLS